MDFNYKGNLNVFKFLKLAQDNDLLVILRPSPFIDAEWDMGGIPSWVLWENPDIKLRSSDLDYNYHVARWYDELLPRLKPFLYSNGGPIISMQVENEYGSVGCDKNYTSFLRDLLRHHLGNDLVLFTNDGAADPNLKCGSVPGVLATLDFGPEPLSEIKLRFDLERKHNNGKGPLVCSEFYPGWLDHWQKPHNKGKTTVVSTALDNMLEMGANVNIYMYHGGTSFGYMAGANLDGDMYDPCPTSYDYDAPLTEAGDPTEKYFAIKSTIAKYMEVPKENPVVKRKAAYGKVALELYTSVHDTEFLTLFAGRSIASSSALSFEQLKIGSGFALYQTPIDFKTSDPIVLKTPQLRDRGIVFVDEEFVGILSRTENNFAIPIRIKLGQTLTVLVENQGRIASGDAIGENKGLGNNITLGTRALHNWTIFPLGEIDGKKLLKYSQGLKDKSLQIKEDFFSAIRNRGSARFFAGNFTLPRGTSRDEILDTYVRLDGFNKGFIWINGINLGRYWPVVGPQETLYLPSTFLKPFPDTNTFIVFELEQAPNACLGIPAEYSGSSSVCYITMTDTHVIDAPTPYDGMTTRTSEERFWQRT
ncbi:beta-galactosidase isoform X2 [Folsomia candida]|nr:beta-galactosidase isoform X2 [Folsomia candida]